VVEGDPISLDATARYASFLFRRGRPRDALSTLRSALRNAMALEPALMFATAAEESGTAADKQDAIAFLNRVRPQLGGNLPNQELTLLYGDQRQCCRCHLGRLARPGPALARGHAVRAGTAVEFPEVIDSPRRDPAWNPAQQQIFLCGAKSRDGGKSRTQLLW
jgi:hypothetical protein